MRKIGSTVYCYDANGNMVKRGGSTITYASYNLPTVINQGSNSSTLSYGAFRNRYKQVAVSSGTTETTIYVAGLFEKVTLPGGVIEYRHTIPGGNGTAAIHTRRSTGINSTFYWHADHLGSPELFTDTGGTALVRPSFGAFGERRDGTDWNGAPSAADLATLAGITRRGFTGHEHLDSVGLIHMNGRVYDPAAARFLSRDPFVDGVFSSQGPNGYAYVRNNPLRFFDPTGYCRINERGEIVDCDPLPEVPVTGTRINPIPTYYEQPGPPTHSVGSGGGGHHSASNNPDQSHCSDGSTVSADDAVTMASVAADLAQPLVDINLAASASASRRSALARASARVFAVTGGGFAVWDVGRGLYEEDYSRAAWGAADLGMTTLAFSGVGAPVVAMYFAGRFTMEYLQGIEAESARNSMPKEVAARASCVR